MSMHICVEIGRCADLSPSRDAMLRKVALTYYNEKASRSDVDLLGDCARRSRDWRHGNVGQEEPLLEPGGG